MFNEFLFIKKVENNIKSLIDINNLFVICLSGGIDSICLCDIFYKISKKYNLNICIAHLHHGIRGLEADRDLNFVKNYSKNKNIKMFYRHVNAIEYKNNNKLTLEESARILRYKFFNDLNNYLSSIRNNKKVYFVLAHHQNDQVETIVFNVLRGTGIDGLMGMRLQNNNFIRPLINISKKQIVEYVKFNKLEYINDSSNEDINITRNFIRLNCLPLLDKVNKNYTNHICDLSDDIKEINNYFENQANIYYEQSIIQISDDSISLDAKKILQYDKIYYKYITNIGFSKLNITKKEYARQNFNDITNIFLGFNNRHLDLPYNLILDKKNNLITFKLLNYNLSMKKRSITMNKYQFKTLIDYETIMKRIKELGEQITNDYIGKEIHCICVLKGAVQFMTEIIKYIKNDNLTIDFMAVSSYGIEKESTGIVKIIKDLDEPLYGKNVLIVEDILDTGYTLDKLTAIFKTREPNSIKICTLLDKPSRRVKEIYPDYVGFSIENVFVLGHGLDFEEYYENCKDIYQATLSEE